MDKFTHIVVSTEGAFGSVVAGTAYFIGTFAECARYVLQMGIRAKTTIEPF